MPVDRIVEGFKLYQKGCVTIIDESDEELQFEVISNGTTYLVVMRAGSIKCIECADWTYRFGETVAEMGSFLCKHCNAAMFKLAEIKGVNQQKQLNIWNDNPVITKEYEKQLNNLPTFNKEFKQEYQGDWKPKEEIHEIKSIDGKTNLIIKKRDDSDGT